MSTWKKILTEDDGNLATTNLTQSTTSRTYTLSGTASNLRFISGFGNAVLQISSGINNAGQDTLTVRSNITNFRGSADSLPAQIALFESVDNGGLSVTLSAPNLTENYSLLLPTADGSDGEFLKTDGAGNLSFAAAGGSVTIDNYAENRVLTAGDVTGNIDAETSLVYSPYSIAQQNNGSTNLLLNQGVYLSKSNGSKPTGFVMDTDNSYGDGGLDAGSTSSDAYANTGLNLSLQFTSSSLTQGRLHMLNSSGALILPQANAGNTSSGMVGLYISADLSTQTSATLLMQGMVLLPNTCFEGTFDESAILYLSDTTAGKLTYTIPNTAGDIVRHMGYAVRQVTANSVASTLIYFNPSVDFLEIA